jgi:anti-anti-sigma regulatory factor
MRDTTAAEGLKIRLCEEADRMVCYAAGELDSTTAPTLRVVLNEQLAGALRRFEQTGHRLSLREPKASLRRVFDVTGLNDAFPIE